jgi:hypothetical protein
MADPSCESKSEALKLAFDRRLILRFRGSVISSDGGLLAYRELDDALALTASGGERLAEARTGRNRRHFDGIVAWTQTRQTNGFIEALNGLFQAAKRKARGYTRFATMRTVLFLIAGKLDFTRLNPDPPSPHKIQ